MDIDVLISKVFINPPIWDRRLPSHKNRHVVDTCWRRISQEMNVDGAILRKKWKYLRDQFTVESSKVKPPRSEHTASEPKWTHYKQLKFLRDVIRPRGSSSNLTPKPTTSIVDGYEPCGSETDGLEQQEFNFVVKTESENTAVLSEDSNASNDMNTPPQHTKRRRISASDDLNNENILQLDEQDINTLQSNPYRDPENDDLLFFKSLLPFVSKIQPEKKLGFRSRIHEVVEEFAYGDSSHAMLGASFSSSFHSRPSSRNSYAQLPPDEKPLFESHDDFHLNYDCKPDCN